MKTYKEYITESTIDAVVKQIKQTVPMAKTRLSLIKKGSKSILRLELGSRNNDDALLDKIESIKLPKNVELETMKNIIPAPDDFIFGPWGRL